MRSDNLNELPGDLPAPFDDGACDHLAGMRMPTVSLQSTSGRWVRMDQLEAPCTVIYCYPRTGRPNQEPEGGIAAWNAILGARGCTPQSCAYRDHYVGFHQANADVFGLSTQTTEYQLEMVERLHIPFEVLSDSHLELARALQLPSFEYAGMTLLKRFTFVVQNAKIAKVFYPVFPPDRDAESVLEWLHSK